jgi:hypothetical protein
LQGGICKHCAGLFVHDGHQGVFNNFPAVAPDCHLGPVRQIAHYCRVEKAYYWIDLINLIHRNFSS